MGAREEGRFVRSEGLPLNARLFFSSQLTEAKDEPQWVLGDACLRVTFQTSKSLGRSTQNGSIERSWGLLVPLWGGLWSFSRLGETTSRSSLLLVEDPCMYLIRRRATGGQGTAPHQ